MVLTVTAPARDKILELRAQEDDPYTLGLRIEVTGAGRKKSRRYHYIHALPRQIELNLDMPTP